MQADTDSFLTHSGALEPRSDSIKSGMEKVQCKESGGSYMYVYA